MIFIILLALTTLSIASAAAYFSICGLAQIFSGAFWPVVIMASALEAGKLMTASYVYRYWKHLTWIMKSYLISAIIVLMMITSAGIFGFLTSAHQEGTASFTEVETKISSLQQQIDQDQQSKSQKLERRKQIDNEVANLPNNFVRGREKLSKQFNDERVQIEKDVQRYDTEIESYTKQMSDFKLTETREKLHVGPILYVARALGKDPEDAIIWMTVLIMFAFDPLAVVLTIGFNLALAQRKEEFTSTQLEHALENVEPIIIDDYEQEPSPSITSIDELKGDDEDWDFENFDTDGVEQETSIVQDIAEATDISVSEEPIIDTKKKKGHPPNIRRILKIDKK